VVDGHRGQRCAPLDQLPDVLIEALVHFDEVPDRSRPLEVDPARVAGHVRLPALWTATKRRMQRVAEAYSRRAHSWFRP